MATPGSVRGSIRNKHHTVYHKKSEANDIHKKKKKFHETYKKQNDEVLTELYKKYRDRAKERRDCGSEQDATLNTAYHSVGPGTLDMDAAERRRQLIEESKYLGGDMEHTHLVKGLDYALLNKVKTEIQSKEVEEILKKQKEDEIKKEEELKRKSSGFDNSADISFDSEDRYAVKSKFAETILKTLFNKPKLVQNDLFIPGRMSYHYELGKIPFLILLVCSFLFLK